MEDFKEKYEQLKRKHDKLVENLQNYRNRLDKDINNISNILEKQPFTIFYSEEYYHAQKLEKMKTGITIDSLLDETWIIDVNGNIIECQKEGK